MKLDRREFLGAAAVVTAMGPFPQDPPYLLSCNVQLMFPGEMNWVRRLEVIAGQGLKAYSIWGFADKNVDELAKAAERLGLTCGSMGGSSKTGFGTGLTKTGAEEAFYRDFEEHAQVAVRLGAKNLITFAGAVQKDIPWEVQHRQILAGLPKAGEIAAKYGVYLCLEPLNPFDNPGMSISTATQAFKIVQEVGHPHVKVDFDMYHLQLSEGNLINNLKLGLSKGWIRFVEIGDVPGRKEPGTGEVNYENIFRALRDSGFSGIVGMEHGATSTPERAIQTVKRVAGVS